MNKNEMKKILKLLRSATKVEKKNRKNYLKTCSPDEIHAICGATKNIIEENIEIPKSKRSYLKKKLKPHKKKLRYLSNPRNSIERKRLLLKNDQVGAGIFTAIASIAIPALIAALSPT